MRAASTMPVGGRTAWVSLARLQGSIPAVVLLLYMPVMLKPQLAPWDAGDDRLWWSPSGLWSAFSV